MKRGGSAPASLDAAFIVFPNQCHRTKSWPICCIAAEKLPFVSPYLTPSREERVNKNPVHCTVIMWFLNTKITVKEIDADAVIAKLSN
jgi:hypothetical protein